MMTRRSPFLQHSISKTIQTSSMYSPLTRHRGSAILISLFILIVLTVMTTVFMEKLLRFSRASEGIENSNVAYYHALWGIEETLYSTGVNKYTPWNVSNQSVWSTTGTGKNVIALTWGTTVPVADHGNSPYDDDWNIIGIGDPVQLVIPEGIDWNTVDFYFRIPQITSDSSTGVHITMANSGVILWTLTSTGNSLFASGETNIFLGNAIDSSPQVIATKLWSTSTGQIVAFGTFYDNYLGINGSICSGYHCVLKLSMIRELAVNNLASGENTLSFLEYKIDFDTTSIPQEYMKIQATGYANGFLRKRILELPQLTTDGALEFAVLQ